MKQPSLVDELVHSNEALKEEIVDVSVDDVLSDYSIPPTEEFVASIRQLGVVEPIIVKPNREGQSQPYRVVNGRRRLAAAKIVGLEKVKAVVRTYEKDAVTLLVGLATQAHRSENPIAEFRSLKDLIGMGYMMDEIMEISGLSEARIKRLLKLEKLADDILDGVSDGKIALGTALAMTKLSYKKYEELLEKFRTEGRLTGKDVLESRQAEVIEEADEAAQLLGDDLSQVYDEPVGVVEAGPFWIPSDLYNRARELAMAYEISDDMWQAEAWRLMCEKIERVEKREMRIKGKKGKNGQQEASG